ncbi:MAG: hypothetical protein ALECFALPRED_004507 [Alectoria fallacina]|uniref:NACHT domain-containing protein n=1 Tax=Alectoria fallacina TaxID=1903189 RepID=A0A8H3FVJ7_9LECA|nr:MAG: hypothetical protein ALECFALPRED_004507 [Alectoria fallacina]
MESPEHDFVVLNDEDVAGTDSTGQLPQSVEQIQKIRAWLHPTDYSADSGEYKRHLASYVHGTGKWMQETQYQLWRDAKDYGALWVKAIPGAGKSVATAHLIAQLENDENFPVLYFFFRQIITSNRKPSSLIRDWMSQILKYSPFLQAKLKEYLDNRRAFDSVAFDELWHDLTTALCALSHVYCVADALDEMSLGNDNFIEQLARLGDLKPATVKVFFTSRPVPRIENILKGLSVSQITLGQSLVDQDVAIYLKHRLANSTLPETFRAEVQRALMKKSQGLFLYTKLMVDDLFESPVFDSSHPASFHENLQSLPSGLAEMYTRMLHDHSVRSGVSQSLQQTILQWVTHSSRPLRLLEIAGMVDSLPEEAHSDIRTDSAESSQNTKSIVRSACGPLLEILEDETVSIIHHSFTEYLLDSDRGTSAPSAEMIKPWFPSVDTAASHRSMAIICVNYLICGWADDWHYKGPEVRPYHFQPHPPSEAVAVYAKYPFLKYANSCWSHHAVQFGQADQDLFQLLDRFMAPNSKAFAAWHELRKAETRFAKGSALLVAAGEGLAFYVEHLIQLGQPINDEDTDGRTAMHRAAAKGHFQVVKILLKHGADSDPDDNVGLKPLHLAAWGNHAAVVKVLLEAGVDPRTPKTKEDPGNWCGNAPRTYGDTPDRYAFNYGHTEAALELVPYLKPEHLNEALIWATEAGKSEIVLAVLDTGKVEINAVTNGKTLVYLAAYRHDLRLFQKALSLGADIGIKCSSVFGRHGIRSIGPDDELESTPLHAFARNCHESPEAEYQANQENARRILQLLLESGSDVNAIDAAGRTPLHLAVTYDRYARSADAEIAAELLRNGANPSATTIDGSQALHLVNCNGPIIRHLVESGADVNVRHLKTGRTPLHYSVGEYSDDKFSALIEFGASCSAEDGNGDTPLHVALRAFTYSISKIEVLLKNLADPNVKNKKGETPLHVMGDTGNFEEVLALLVKFGADLEAKTPSGQSVLMKFLLGWRSRSSPGNIQTLLHAGARIDSQDYDGRSILHLLCQDTQSVSLIRELVNAGADPLAVDFAGNTLLHYVARHAANDYYSKKLQELLETVIEFGVEPSSKNNLGQIPFHIAAGTREQPLANCKTDPLDFLLGPKCNSDVNAADSRGVRPIHLAATFCEKRVRRLLIQGADANALTVEGQSLLHIASRARQSNIVGLLIDLYVSRDLSRLIDHVDKDGRTALHYACRSGRVESVRVLLDVGADPNSTDHNGMSPLDACSEFPEDDFLWNLNPIYGARTRFMDAAYITLDDLDRPKEVDNHRTHSASFSRGISSEHDTVAIRQIVRLLLAHDSDVTSKPLKSRYDPFNPFPSVPTNTHLDFAVASRCEVLVDELLRKIESTTLPHSEEDKNGHRARYSTPRNAYLERYLSLTSRKSAELLDDMVQVGQLNSDLFESLLRTENEQGILRFRDLGGDLVAPRSYGDGPLTILTKWGYSDLLAQVCPEASVMDEQLRSAAVSNERPGRITMRPLLHTACERTLPNLEVIKILVEKVKVDINAHQPAVTALHLLAKSAHWWQTGALEYLIDRGANFNAKDINGYTPLRIAVENRGRESTRILLRRGADVNTIGGDGMSCLNKAGADSEIVRLLLEYGASVTAGKVPFIFDAIDAMDLDILKTLVQTGADCNISMMLSEDERERRYTTHFPGSIHPRDLGEKTYPIHFAANARYNTKTSQPKMIPIIKYLLQSGADPFTLNNNKDPILHDLCSHDGITEPFLEIPNIDLEFRDSHGRTLLLAACSRSQGSFFSNEDLEYLETLPTTTASLLAKGAKIKALDIENRNALHCVLASISKSKMLQLDFDSLISHPSASDLVIQADDSGRTALLYALENQHLWAIDTLLEKGADHGYSDNEGNTALHLLSKCLSSNKKAKTHFQKFLSLGIPIEARNSSGETPLFVYMAHSTQYLKRLPVLTNAAANLFTKNRKGQNLLHVIAGKEITREGSGGRWEEEKRDPEVEIFSHLMEEGLDAASEDDEQRTPLDLAVAAGNSQILGLFERKR